ncbi:Uncharacterised protein [[Clostridium] sordellii]|uniref:hypothetical protein n=1 Tax=Paraclostridium sordellii TaxID=1505 RepID=UPI0005E67D1C|nr:hypothetical protein [Paeniclostridium sordellii]CEP45677.1 Uncharacterised protein [[Clostridium] sordellii] [Paeniclostridium sordellii]
MKERIHISLPKKDKLKLESLKKELNCKSLGDVVSVLLNQIDNKPYLNFDLLDCVNAINKNNDIKDINIKIEFNRKDKNRYV